MNKPVPVVYIAGSSHSGSTILDLLLGSHSRVESIGEGKKLPELLRSMASGARPLCTCQQNLAECPVWGELLSRHPGDLRHDAAANAALFERVLNKRNRTVVLDSSKTVGRALLLHRSELFAPVFVHLVRDSRAVAFSSKRKRTGNGVRGHGLFETARGWQKLNTKIPLKLSRGKSRSEMLAVRYENLTDNPRSVLERILGAMDLGWEDGMLNFRQHVHHNVEGNRMRMGTATEIIRDEEYLRSLGAAEWLFVTMLTWRGLRKFGYPLKRSPVAPGPTGTVPSLR